MLFRIPLVIMILPLITIAIPPPIVIANPLPIAIAISPLIAITLTPCVLVPVPCWNGKNCPFRTALFDISNHAWKFFGIDSSWISMIKGVQTCVLAVVLSMVHHHQPTLIQLLSPSLALVVCLFSSDSYIPLDHPMPRFFLLPRDYLFHQLVINLNCEFISYFVFHNQRFRRLSVCQFIHSGYSLA